MQYIYLGVQLSKGAFQNRQIFRKNQTSIVVNQSMVCYVVVVNRGVACYVIVVNHGVGCYVIV